MTPPDIFNTDRLTGRRPRGEDAPAVFDAYASDPEVTRFLTWPPYTEIEPLKAWLDMQAKRWDDQNPVCLYLLCLTDTNSPIGAISLHFSPNQVMFGYVLGKAHWGRGYMSEALRYLVEWALAQPELFRAYAFCDVDNPASARVMEKAGMTREGILRRYHIAPNISPEPRDCIMCAKVR